MKSTKKDDDDDEEADERTENDLKVTDFYSSCISYHDTKCLVAADANEQTLKLKSHKYIPEKEYLGEELPHLISKLCEQDQVNDWIVIFLLSYNDKRHFVQCIIDGCVNLLQQREYEKAGLVISQSWLKYLAPLLIILSWVQCSYFTDAVLLIKYLLLLGNEDNFLTSGCKKLVYRNKLIEWSLKKVEESLSPAFECTELVLIGLFKRLKSSSLLDAINQTKLITLLKFEDINDLLKNQPTNQQQYNISNQLDVFYCYWILRRFTNIIVSSSEGVLIEYDNKKVLVTKHIIHDYISDIGLVMQKLVSPIIRLELLENIFSLLFLRRSDFNHQPGEDIDSDNLSMDSNLSQNLSRSLDSLFLTDDHVDFSLNITKDDFYNSVQCFKNKDFNDSLLQDEEVSDSSEGTVMSNNCPPFPSTSGLIPGFVTSTLILKEMLSFISNNLCHMTTSWWEKHILENTCDFIELENRTARLSNCISEALWRLELVSGLHPNHISRTALVENENLMNTVEHNVISYMLGSFESLVYLTMKKQNLVQTEQVIKMYDLKVQPCCEEVDFIEDLQRKVLKLQDISDNCKLFELQRTDSPLDMIRSNASAGKLSSDVNVVAESLLQHSLITKGNHDIPLIDTSVCIDLMFSAPLSYTICKSLLDLANLKAEICDQEELVTSLVTRKLKLIKMFLQFTYNKKYSRLFEWQGERMPNDYLHYYVILPNWCYSEVGGLSYEIAREGEDAFDRVSTWISILQHDYNDLVEENINVGENSLMHKVRSLFSVFKPEVIGKLNGASSIYDYLKVLFKYVNKFSRWQLNHKDNGENDGGRSISPSKNLYAANPFLVFNEDISDTFGRLLFEWQVPPKKLEGFAYHANMKLIKIIAERCGVFVSSNKELKRNCEWFMLFENQLLLNSFGECHGYMITGKSPNVTVGVLLNNVQEIRNKSNKFKEAAVDIASFLNSSTNELRQIDIGQLKTYTEKLTFSINLFNLLFLHSFVLIMDDKLCSQYHVCLEEFLNILQSSFGRLIFYNHFSYKVGKVGLVSALDLYRNIIKCGNASNFFGIHKESYAALVPSLLDFTGNTDCSSYFALQHEINNSTLMPVYHSDTVINDLVNLPLIYLEENIKIDHEKLEIIVPEYILMHKTCFLSFLKNMDEKENLIHEQSYGDSEIEDDEAIIDNIEDVVNGADECNIDSDHADSDDGFVATADRNEINSLLIHLSNIASPDFKNILKNALEKYYLVKVEKKKWFCTNDLINSDQYDNKNAIIQRTPSFSLMSTDIYMYLKESCLLAGTLIEICIKKNQLLKQLTTIFNNNVLYNSVNETDKKLSVFTSLQDGLLKFKSLNITKYDILKKVVAESSILFERVMKSTEYFEFSLPESLMNKFYSSIQKLLCYKFIHTLSPDQWTEIVPILLECSFHSRHFWKIIISNLELFVPMCRSLFEVVLCHCMSEIIDFGNTYASTFDLEHTLKRLLLLLVETENRFRYILMCEHLLPIYDIIRMIKICLEDKNCSTRSEIHIYLKRYEWYEKIFQLHTFDDNIALNSWHSVKNIADEQPEKILQLLISSSNNHLIDMWYGHFNLPNNVILQSLQWKLKCILNNEGADFLSLQLALDKIESDSMCLDICNYLLLENNAYNSRNIYIIQYMVSALSNLLDPEEEERLILNKIGIFIIGMIPVGMQDLYHCLQNNPILIIEQLLMNMKVKLVSKALACIHLESLQLDCKILSNLESNCDELVAKYAELALDLSALKQDRSESDYNGLIASGLDFKLERKSSTASQPSIIREKENYSPLHPVDPKKWIKDNDVVSCMLCRDLFNIFNRRHHCRHCGRVICTTCSPYYCYMVRYKRKMRTCIRCFKNNYQKPQLAENCLGDKDNTGIDIAHVEDYVFDSPNPYTLTCDENVNKETRETFLYEKAPSASLCLSIVDLHSSNCAAAGLLVKFSKGISQYMHENHQEIDISIVTKMLELVLYHAKLKFLKDSDFDGIECTESYRSQIETVKILVESNWPEIPSMQELTQPEWLRQLRDQLLENEQFHLAIELTSKCAFDTTINFKMGLSRLKYGDLDKAREYFARCLTSTQGESLNTLGPNYHYLERIIEEIENSPLISINHVNRVGNTLLPTSLFHIQKNSSSECILDSKRYDEILFYLKTYGSHNHLISFFAKQRLYRKAILLIRKEKCSPDQFVTYLLIPAFQEGFFYLLTNELNFDSQHRFWEPYLTQACKYLSKQGFYHCLYELQLVMKDYFRAALTCVRFFIGSMGELPSTYGQLNQRLRYLNHASNHLETLLKDRSSFVNQVGYSLLGEDKIVANQEVPISDVKHHLYTVQLQIEVTNFLNSMKPLFSETKILTLFGNGKERAELVILILLYCSEESVLLASKIIKEFKLPSLPIVVRAVKRMTTFGKYDVISSIIVQCQSGGLISANDKDEVLLQVVKLMVMNNQIKNANQFIKLMRSDVLKVNALITCGHLREAYLESVKNERHELIENILVKAKERNQHNMIDICEKWIRNFNDKGK